MATYLLLRDNKNSGPYTLEALIQLGLKAYDLVWVEGRSAAWRYPSEIDDLKFYAPVVEEQPYDRFYRKPSVTNTETEKKQPAQQEEKLVRPEIDYSIPAEVKQTIKVNEVKPQRKQVFVSLPANSGTTFIKKPEQVTAAALTPSINEFYNGDNTPVNPVRKADTGEAPSYSELVNQYNNNQPRDRKIFVEEEELSLQKKNNGAETKYSQSLDDIKDIYVQTLADRKRKAAQKKLVMNLMKRGLPFAAVLILGFIMGGFLMNRKGNQPLVTQPAQNNPGLVAVKPDNKKDSQLQAIVLPQTGQPEAGQQQVPANTDNTVTENPTETALLKSHETPRDLKLDKNSTALPLNVVRKFVAKQNETAKADNKSQAVTSTEPQNIVADSKTGERNKIVRSAAGDNTDANNPAPATAGNSLMKQVNVKGNDYKVGTFGGIHDLELTVTNNSNFLLDHVMVELQYLKPSQQPLKTNNVRFDNVPPNGSLTLAIPATNRGIKVVYKVINVQSKAAGNDTAGR